MTDGNLETEYVTLTKLTPHPRNVRQGDVGAISLSLTEHGQYRPLVVQRSTGQIIAGNHTYKAAKALGWKQLAVNYLDVTDEQALRILLVDNRTNDLATYDDNALTELLTELAATEQTLTGTGYNEDDLDELLGTITNQPITNGNPDDIPEFVPIKTITGDTWLLGPHRLVCGDSTVSTDVDKLMDGDKADMVYADPPYGMNLDTDYTKMTGNKYDPVIGDNQQFDAQPVLTAFAYCKEIFLWGADYYVETLKRQYPNLGSWIVWDKYSDDRIGLLDGKFGSAFETCWSKTPHKRDIARVLVKTNYTSKGDETRVHPTQKPVALAEWFFKRWSKEGSIVVDLFGGSGSTLIAAHQTGRVARLMELDPHYCDVICARYQRITNTEPINATTGEPHNFLTDETVSHGN